MTTTVIKHSIVTLRQHVNKFDGFTVYMFVGVDCNGEELAVEFFHTHSDALVCEPVMHKDYSTAFKEKTDEDE